MARQFLPKASDIEAALKWASRTVDNIDVYHSMMSEADGAVWYSMSVTSEEMQRLREERKRLSTTCKALLDEISAILFRHDPIGINFDDNTDEYDAEAGTILARLRPDASVEEVTAIVHEEFIRWFGTDTAGPRQKYSAFAPEILCAYTEDRGLKA